MGIYYVYALRSKRDGRIYVGFSSDVERRLVQHNTGKTKSTKGHIPWQLVHIEEIADRSAAREKEKHYKSGIGKEFLKSLQTENGPVVQRIE
ncbi:GIY-YIG nuclease family protein [Olivibacter sitiensis]|uniref:GIY-YIG nuclease family protein n=1 Tax=Olivibacter sitiensis TaxID=376470 RepID=UPI0009FECF92|nr:GIY-YIG nuclease family protein [Olivibacter sitiensis]